MGTSWVKLLVVAAALFIASGTAHAHAKAPHEESLSAPCAAHDHKDAGHPQNAGDDGDCCCGCFNCASGIILPPNAIAPSLVAFDMAFGPPRATPLKSHMFSPELDPPRPIALS